VRILFDAGGKPLLKKKKGLSPGQGVQKAHPLEGRSGRKRYRRFKTFSSRKEGRRRVPKGKEGESTRDCMFTVKGNKSRAGEAGKEGGSPRRRNLGRGWRGGVIRESFCIGTWGPM